jgi:hypothetical protein
MKYLKNGVFWVVTPCGSCKNLKSYKWNICFWPYLNSLSELFMMEMPNLQRNILPSRKSIRSSHVIVFLVRLLTSHLRASDVSLIMLHLEIYQVVFLSYVTCISVPCINTPHNECVGDIFDERVPNIQTRYSKAQGLVSHIWNKTNQTPWLLVR